MLSECLTALRLRPVVLLAIMGQGQVGQMVTWSVLGQVLCADVAPHLDNAR